MTDLVKRLVGLANSLGGDDEDVIMAGVAEIERLTAERANRYWEGRYRDEKAEVERLEADNERLRKCICDIYSIWENAAKEREAEIARLRKLNDEQQARMLDWHMQLTAKDAEIKRLTALRGDEAVAENARVVAEFAKLRAEIERLRAVSAELCEAMDDCICWLSSGFAPQSQSIALEKAAKARAKFRALEQKR